MKNIINKLNKIIVNVYSGQNNEDTEKQLHELAILMKKKQTRGGTRINAGRPNKYTCDVKKVLISVPVDAIPAIKKYINKQKLLFTPK